MSTIAGGGQWSGRQYGDGDRYEGAGAVVWLVLAAGLVLVAVALVCGCTTMPGLLDQLEHSLTNAVPVVSNTVPATVTNAPPVVEIPADGAIGAPILGDHGAGRCVRNPSGKEWIQWTDGYWERGGESLFIRNLDKFSLPGIGKGLAAAGGRDCGRARIVNVAVRATSTHAMGLCEGGVWDNCPDQQEWTVELAGNFAVTFTYAHWADVMSKGVVTDRELGVAWEFGCNGYRIDANTRGYDYFTDGAGKRWPTGIRMIAPGETRAYR